MFGVYWGTAKGVFQRLHYVIDLDELDIGFEVLLENEIEIVNSSLDHYFLMKDEYGGDALVHKVAYKSPEFFSALVDSRGNEYVEEVLQRVIQLGLSHN